MLWPIATFLMHLLDVRACVCMRIQMCGGFASKITDGIVTGSSWTIYGVFLFMNGDLFGTTPTILNGIYVILLNFRRSYTYIFGSLLNNTIIWKYYKIERISFLIWTMPNKKVFFWDSVPSFHCKMNILNEWVTALLCAEKMLRQPMKFVFCPQPVVT